jgi:hypothetical protein
MPSKSEIREYADWLGMKPGQDDEFLPIALEGLTAKMPEGWRSCKSAEGEIFYFNTSTGESTWDHPIDSIYREKFIAAKSRPIPTSDAEIISQLQQEITALKTACTDKDKEITNLNETLAGLIETLRASQAEVLQLSSNKSGDDSAQVRKELGEIKLLLENAFTKQRE